MPLLDLPPLPPLSPPAPVAITLTAEHIEVNDGYRMGLAGLRYERRYTPHGSGGMAVYSAVSGDRGGFFGWGVNGAWHTAPGPWQAEVGLFVGGGGGSPSWVGSGLMLRPHAEVTRQSGPFSWGLGVSRVVFPDGRVGSTQPYATLRWNTAVHLHEAEADAASAALPPGVRAVESELGPIVGAYRMQRSPRRDGSGATPLLWMGGLAYRQALPTDTTLAGGRPYTVLTTVGAMYGGYDGYAELTGGLGLQWRLAPTLRLRAEAAVGSSGAGATVDTGGGLIGKVGAGLQWQPGRAWALGLHAGRIASQGPFKAQELRVEWLWRGWDLAPRGSVSATAHAPEAGDGADAPREARWATWHAAAGLKHFPRMLRDTGAHRAVDMLGLKVERAVAPGWHVLAEAGSGVTGLAGGYATGQVGLGWLAPLTADRRWQAGAEASLGAAGGGGVVVAGGLFGQAQVQVRHALDRTWALQADAGWLKAARGALSSPMVGVSLVSRFGRLEGR